MSPPVTPARVRFEAKVDKSGECWVWMASVRPNGYASFYVHGKTTSAHRYAYEEFVGPIPDGMHLDHLCRNRRCVNPDHLEAVSPQENVLRGASVAAEVVRTNACSNGHELTEDNVYRWHKRPEQRVCRTCMRDRQNARNAAIRARGCGLRPDLRSSRRVASRHDLCEPVGQLLG